jgi:hypothetical protein
MKTIQLNFNLSSTQPVDTQDGRKFLLCWGGWQFGLYYWSSERGDFYSESGDYLASWDNPFVWAELPLNLNPHN